MQIRNLGSMPFEDLWDFYEELTVILRQKIAEEKAELERRLTVLSRARDETGEMTFGEDLVNLNPAAKMAAPRAKYRNIAAPFEVWSGRGRQPRWLKNALESGGTLDEFKIGKTDDHNGPGESNDRGP